MDLSLDWSLILFYFIILAAVFKELLPKADYFSKGLYTIDIGQNDLTAALFLNMTTEEVKGVVPDIIKKFIIVIQVK